jgi:hypothetical protein
MNLVKAMLLGAVLTWVIALVIGSQGTDGGVLYIHHVQLGSVSYYWSWPLFLASSAVFTGILVMMD